MREINTLIVHCSATTADQDIGVDDIRRWHTKENGWSDVGYHYIIRRNGAVEEGRSLERSGAHAKGYNQKSIGICLVGGIAEEWSPEFNYTISQMRALSGLCARLSRRFSIKKIIGHNEVSSKACPCFNVGEYLEIK